MSVHVPIFCFLVVGSWKVEGRAELRGVGGGGRGKKRIEGRCKACHEVGV